MGSRVSRVVERRVMAPVCQCSSSLPVVSMNGYSLSGISAGGRSSETGIFPSPSGVGNWSLKMMSSPGALGLRTG